MLDEDPALPQKKGHNPQFSAHDYCCHTAGWIKMPLGTEVNLGPGDAVLDGDPAGQSPLISAHVYCGQTAGWIKITLGVEVILDPGHIVLDGDPAAFKNGAQPCVEVWQTSDLRPLRLGEEKKIEERRN